MTGRERRALALAVSTGALVPLNSTMIAVGLPRLADDLGVARASAAVLVTAYLVAMLLCQPIGGRLGDRWGTRRVLRLALVGFIVASALAGLARSFPAVLVGRCVQAVFAAALIPNAQALLRGTVDVVRRGRVFGLVGTGIGAGAAIGPVVGGILAEGAGWQGIFFVNVPLGLLALVLLARVADVPVEFPEETAPSPAGTAATGDGRRSFGLLRRPAFRAACLSQSTSTFALYTVLLVLPVVLAERGWRGTAVGLATASLTVGLLVLGPVGGGLGDRRGRVLPIVVGLGIVVAGCTVLTVAVDTAAGVVAGPLVMGIGLGLAGASLQAAALEAVPQGVAGSAAGVFSASRYVGSITGSVAISASGVVGASTARGVLAATIVAAIVATAAGGRAVPASDTAADPSPVA